MMEPDAVAKQSSRRHAVLILGSTLVLVGGLAALGSSFLVWETRMMSCNSATPYNGGVLGAWIGIVGMTLALQVVALQDHVSPGLAGSMVGWWLASVVLFVFLTQDGGTPAIGFYLVGFGVVAGLIGSTLLLIISHPQSAPVVTPWRQWLAVLALVVALGTPVATVILLKTLPSSSFQTYDWFILIGLLLFPIIAGGVALSGKTRSELAKPHQIMGGMAITFALATLVDPILLVFFALQHLFYCAQSF
jgi:hypothetical protein